MDPRAAKLSRTTFIETSNNMCMQLEPVCGIILSSIKQGSKKGYQLLSICSDIDCSCYTVNHRLIVATPIKPKCPSPYYKRTQSHKQ